MTIEALSQTHVATPTKGATVARVLAKGEPPVTTGLAKADGVRATGGAKGSAKAIAPLTPHPRSGLSKVLLIAGGIGVAGGATALVVSSAARGAVARALPKVGKWALIAAVGTLAIGALTGCDPKKPSPPPQPAISPEVKSAVKIANDAAYNGQKESASSAYRAAVDASRTTKDAMYVADAAGYRGYREVTSRAYEKAIDRATTVKDAVKIGDDASYSGYSESAAEAYARGTSLASSSKEARSVAEAANYRGLRSTASSAYIRAAELATTPDEARKVASAAEYNGHREAASQAYQRATELAVPSSKAPSAE